MKKNDWKIKIFVVTLIGLFMFSAQAELGLGEVFESQGTTAVGEVVKAAAEAAYAESDDPAEIQGRLVEILNEAAATGDEGVMTYAIVAVMMAGGSDNLAIGQAAVAASNIGEGHSALASATMASAVGLIGGGSEGDPQGGEIGDTGETGETGGTGGTGGTSDSSDPFNPNPFDPGGFDDGDGDIPATRV